MKYVGIRSEGGLIPYDTLDQIAQETVEGQKASSFGLSGSRRLSDEISSAWSQAQNHWSNFSLKRDDPGKDDPYGTTLTRRRWITRLLEDCVDYSVQPYGAGPVVNGKTYAISHRAGENEDAPAVHIEGFRINLDERLETRRMSAHALVQQYLNVREGQLWGIVTNGLELRLLRQATRSAKPSYVEFDLESILDENRFNEFTLFYRLCHRTRLPKGPEDAASCLLEKYFQIAIDQGGRVRDHLRDGVERALIKLGTGLLRNPANTGLIERAKSGALSPIDLHRQLLRLVYRFLFLMVAEERRMILPDEPESDLRWKLYDEYYSIGRLRRLCERFIDASDFCDLWEGLKKTFVLFEDGTPSNALGIPPLNGDLFGPLAIRDLAPTRLKNDDLLDAMRELSLFEQKGVKQRINYSALDVEELGSVYESLLDFQPVFVSEGGRYRFELRTGSERKSTGSYYTRPELVRELIESALVPVMEERLAGARDKDPEKQKQQQQQAILAMTVCDPACGSGHFLLAAARRLGRELAKVRTGEEEPSPTAYHVAVRDVISHCIYGVDLNPLAVDLCKLALWLEGHWTGKPLSFLDHHIKCGNSFIGVLDPKVLEDGIPDEAFTPVTCDDKEVAKAFKKRNKEERKGQYSLTFEAAEHVHQYAATTHGLDEITEETPADVKRKQKIYEEWRNRPDWWHDWTASNIWTAAFFVQLTKFDYPVVPTHDRFLRFVEKRDSQPQMAAAANALAEELRFFHWRLEFPQVFEKGGFDVVLGNPPWDVLQPEEQTFFRAAGATDIADAAGSTRKRLIADLDKTNKPLAEAWLKHRRGFETVNKFTRGSQRFPLTSRGRNNSYTLFAELSLGMTSGMGRSGLVLPIGIVSEETSAEYFAYLVRRTLLVRVLGFENESFIFKGVHHAFKFCAITIAGSENSNPPEFTFFCRRFEDVADAARRFSLSADEVSVLSPNTATCPIFRSAMDAKVTAKLFQRAPVFINTRTGNNPWKVRLQQGLFHMTGDSGLFAGAETDTSLPLYEAKMFHQFDHRWATFMDDEFRDVTSDEKADWSFEPQPRYWVSTHEVRDRLAQAGLPNINVLLAFRNIGRAVDIRTGLFAFIPIAGVGHSASIIFSEYPLLSLMCLSGNLNSLVFDYVLRQKVPGINISFPYLQQVPVLEPRDYEAVDVDFISGRVVRLNFTSNSLRSTLDEQSGNACTWNEDHRLAVRAELDAYYAHLYSLTRDELRYILDPKDVFGEDFPSETFRVLKEREIQEYGEYRTQRLVLEAFDKLADSPRFRDEMPNRESAITPPARPAIVGA